ncbi:hypothetical protein FOZ63_000957 [Perkinsus olseni]|uniref:Uncharacterized protein n=1 Tax=Perkinsus olseni TaxID=32597 RepID=A0A7J6UKU7_PEROL|nr:hypothetical protein FOZ63_000957 [Perkinsus olseni]
MFTLPRKQLAGDLKPLDTSTETISYPRVPVQNTTEITYEGDGDDLGGQLLIDEQIPHPSSQSEEHAAVGRSAASSATYAEEDTWVDGSAHGDSGEVRMPSILDDEGKLTIIYPVPRPADESMSLAPVLYPRVPATSEGTLLVEYPWRFCDETPSIISYPRGHGDYGEGVLAEATVPSLYDSDAIARPVESSEVIEGSAAPETSKGSTGIDEDSHQKPPLVPPAQPYSAGLVDSDSALSGGPSSPSVVENSVSVAVTYPMIVDGSSSSTRLITVRYPDPCARSGSSLSVNYPKKPSDGLLSSLVVYPSVVEQHNCEVLEGAMVLSSSWSEFQLAPADLWGGSQVSPTLTEIIFYPRDSI